MKRRYILANVGILAGCALIFATSATLMWFSNNISIVPTQIEASSEAAYYASGKGTKEDPYVINKARHLYNLAWLQYLGTYNKDEDGDDAVDVTYFSIEGTEDTYGNSVLNMDGWVLPPIGTEDNPFVGIINGNNTIIKNLTVSNTFSDYGKKHPYYDASGNELNENTFTKPSIIGFFGVIGGIDETKTYAYSSIEDVELVEDLYLDNITIQNVNDSSTGDIKVLAGLLAGYVNAPIKNSGVGYGEFNFASGTTNLASTVGASNISKVSEYSLIGAYNPNKFSWEGKAGSDEEGNDRGGSINIYEFSKRWTYMLNKNQTLDSFTITGSNETMGLKGIKFTYKTNKVLYEMADNSISLYNSSYFPINVDTDVEFKNEKRLTFTNDKNKTITYAITDYFSDSTKTSEAIKESNSGYLTTTSSENQTYHYIWKNQKVGASLGFTNNNGYYTSGSYNEDNLVMLNIDSSGNLSRIVDGNNTTNNTNLNSAYSNTIDASSLTQYSKVKAHIKEFLSNDNNYIYSLAWNVKTSTGPSTIDGTFKLNGKTYSKVYAPGVDFYVSQKGYITVVFCSNANGSGNKLFSLYKVTRSDDGTPSIEQVKDVIPTSTSTFASASALLYMQIPVESGEYFIGPDVDSSASTSAGFMYLDIGANAGDSGGDSGDEKTSEIDFVYYDNKKLKKITDTGYTNSKVLFDLGGSASGIIAFKRTYENSSSIVYYYPLTSSGITIIGSESNASGTDTKFDKN